MQDLEEDPELRSRINLYSKPNATKVSTEAMQGSDEDDDFPEIQLGELLDGLSLQAPNASETDGGAVEDNGTTTFDLANVTTLPATYVLNRQAEVVDDDL